LYEQSELLSIPSLPSPVIDKHFLFLFIEYPPIIYHIAGTMLLGLSYRNRFDISLQRKILYRKKSGGFKFCIRRNQGVLNFVSDEIRGF